MRINPYVHIKGATSPLMLQKKTLLALSIDIWEGGGGAGSGGGGVIVYLT